MYDGLIALSLFALLLSLSAGIGYGLGKWMKHRQEQNERREGKNMKNTTLFTFETLN